MLALKLLLVPFFLVMVTLAGKRWGPGIAGWLSGLPFTSGPIIFIVALEQGPEFASASAAACLAAVFSTIVFCAAYAHASLRFSWRASLPLAVSAWTAAIVLLSLLPGGARISLAIALLSLLIAPRIFPKPKDGGKGRPVSAVELAIRAGAGALLTLAVTYSAESIGTSWSGLITTYPVLGTVLAVFSHSRYGPDFLVVLLRAMATSLYSFAAFFLVLSPLLPGLGIPMAFTVAAACALSVQLALLKLRRQSIAPRKAKAPEF